MFPFKMLCVVALMLLTLTVDSCTGGSSDLSGPALTRLYNSNVFLAERMKRPLGQMSFMIGPISHSGVRLTLADGSKWLVHKGENFGSSSQTVVTSARHMGSDWRVVRTLDFEGTKTVADFVADGGSEYNLIFDNCHLASRRMMRKN